MQTMLETLRFEEDVAEFNSLHRVETEVVLDSDLPPAIRFIAGCPAVVSLHAQPVAGGVEIQGTVAFHVLYSAEDGLYCAHTRQNVSWRVEHPVIMPGMMIGTQVCAAPAGVRRVDERCAKATCEITLKMTAARMCEKEVLAALAGNAVQVRKACVEAAIPVLERSETVTVSRDTACGMSLDRVLWSTTRCRVEQTAAREGQLHARGTLCVTTLCARGNTVEKVETEIPFEMTREDGRIDEDMTVTTVERVGDVIARLREDINGERNILSVEVPVEVDCRLWKMQRVMAVEDAYVPSVQLVTEQETVVSSGLPQCRREVVEVESLLTLEDAGNVVQVLNTPCVDTVLVEGDTIWLEGRMSLNLLYETTEPVRLSGRSCEVPFECALQVRGLNETMNVRLGIEALENRVLATKNGFRVRHSLQVSLQMRVGKAQAVLTEAAMTDVQRDLQADLVLLTVGEGDTLWSLAKEVGVTMERLKQCNPQVAEREVRPGERLILEVS